jgi:ribose 5-phosphate isomerase B
MSRRHNNANVLCLSAESAPIDEILQFVKIWLTTDFEGGRHQRRIDQIAKLEDEAASVSRSV